jgi:hypothetical protein
VRDLPIEKSLLLPQYVISNPLDSLRLSQFQARVGDLLRRVESTIDSAADVVSGASDKKAPKIVKPKGEFTSEEDKEKAKEKRRQLKEAAANDDDASSQISLPSTQSTLKSQSSQFVPQYVPSFWRLVHSGKATHVANYLSTGFPHIDGIEPKYGNTVLISAVKKGDVDMVETLLRFNASTKIANEVGDSPIHFCWRFWSRAPLKTPITITDNIEDNKEQVKAKVQELEERERITKEQVRQRYIKCTLYINNLLTTRSTRRRRRKRPEFYSCSCPTGPPRT